MALTLAVVKPRVRCFYVIVTIVVFRLNLTVRMVMALTRAEWRTSFRAVLVCCDRVNLVRCLCSDASSDILTVSMVSRYELLTVISRSAAIRWPLLLATFRA